MAKKDRLRRIITTLVISVAIAWGALEFRDHLLPFVDWIETLGIWGPLIFIGGYTFFVLLFAPGSALTLAAGALFGVPWGAFYAFSGAFLGSTGAFLISRYIAHDWVNEKLGASTRLGAINYAIGTNGLRIIFLLRLAPTIPFNALNYLLGLTRARLRDSMLASVGMMPGTILYVYLGHTASRVAEPSSGKGGHNFAEWSLTIIGLIAGLGAIWLIAAGAKKTLREKLDPRAKQP